MSAPLAAFPRGVPVTFKAADGYRLQGRHWPVANDDGRHPAAMQRLLDCLTSAATHQVQFLPARFGLDEIGHFSPFHSDMRRTLWPLGLRGARPAGR